MLDCDVLEVLDYVDSLLSHTLHLLHQQSILIEQTRQQVETCLLHVVPHEKHLHVCT